MLEAKDPQFRARIADGFARQGAMTSLAAELLSIEPGAIDLALPYSARFAQQHGFLHGGIVATGLDTACGFAAMSLMPPGVEVLTVEFKTNLLAPAKGERFLFRGRVIKPGRTLIVADGQALALREGEERLIATMTATLMALTVKTD